MNCDVCDVLVTENNSARVSAEKFRKLLAQGFGIDETNIKMLTDSGVPRSQAIELLKQGYLASQSGWLLCENCFTKAEEVAS